MAKCWNSIAEIPSFLRENGEIDESAVRKAACRLMAAGWKTVGIAGVGGEYDSLTCAEQIGLIQVVGTVIDRSEIAMGAMDVGTDKTCQRIVEHSEEGVHLHYCTASHYFSLNSDEELIRHFSTLEKADSEGKLLVVDSKAHAGIHLPQTIADGLLHNGHAILHCDSDIASSVQKTGETGIIMSEEAVIGGICEGPFISRLAVLFPEWNGKQTLSHEMRNAMMTVLSVGHHPSAGIKYAAWRLGLCETPLLHFPWMGLNDAQREKVDAALQIICGKEA